MSTLPTGPLPVLGTPTLNAATVMSYLGQVRTTLDPAEQRLRIIAALNAANARRADAAVLCRHDVG